MTITRTKVTDEVRRMACPECKDTRTGTFCYRCGAQLVSRPTCICGYVVHPLDKYCQDCGIAVDFEIMVSLEKTMNVKKQTIAES